jgi:hypothetical protein
MANAAGERGGPVASRATPARPAGGPWTVQWRPRRELFLSEATVKTHIAHILAKLNLRDRVQLVVFAYETGFVEPGGHQLASDRPIP